MKNTPKLRFKEFKDAWGSKKLGQVISYTKGFAFKSEYYADKGSRIIRVSDLGTNSIKENDEVVFTTETEKLDLNKYKILKDEIIITTVGSKAELIESAVGRGILVRNSDVGYLNQNLLKINFSDKVDNRFLFGHINSPRYTDYIQQIQRGNANQANITVADLFEYEINLPTLPEQQKIASFLTAVDEKLQALQQKKTLLENYKKGLMQQLFSQELRFKDENGKKFPDWEVKKLGEIATKRIAKNKDNKIQTVFTNSASQGIINQRDFFDKDIANKNNTAGYYIVEKDDFVYNPRISNLAPVGPISRNHLSTGIMSPLYTVFRIENGDLSFYEHYFNSIYWHEHLKDISNQGARDDRMSFLSNDFYNMPMPFPKIKEQIKISEFLNSFNTKINSTQTQIDQLQTWKKGLLQQMFV